MSTPKKNPAAVALGRMGGKAGTGSAKARTPEQARAAVAARWAKVKAEKRTDPTYGERMGMTWWNGLTRAERTAAMKAAERALGRGTGDVSAAECWELWRTNQINLGSK